MSHHNAERHAAGKKNLWGEDISSATKTQHSPFQDHQTLPKGILLKCFSSLKI